MDSALRFSALSSKALFALTPLLLLPYSFNIQALSATTANTIQGTKPYFTLNGIRLASTSELAGFTYPDASAPSGIATIDTTQSTQVSSSNIILIPAGVKENEISAFVGFSNPLTASTLDSLVKTTGHALQVADDDGDDAVLTDTGAKGTISVVMKKDGNIITPSATVLDACSDYSIEVQISASGTPADVQAITSYGDPNTSQSDYSTSVATYNLLSKDIKMCYLAPENLSIRYSNSSAYPMQSGYSSLWIVGKGFKVSEMKDTGKFFPQTGFKGAVFTVIGSGIDQSQYECVVTPNTGITQSPIVATSAAGKNCTIEYNNVNIPVNGLTVHLIYNPTAPASPVTVETYTTPTPQLWFKPKSLQKYNTAFNFTGSYPAAVACDPSFNLIWVANQPATAAYFFERFELTNARNATVPASGAAIINEFFIRDIDPSAPSLLGEWGSVVWNYSNSGFNGAMYIASSESDGGNYQFRVSADSGKIDSVTPDNMFRTVCR